MLKENRITEGVIWKEVLYFFFPIVISSFFQHFYTIVDGIIVGQNLGDVAFSAVGGSAAKLSGMLINFFVGVSTGITAYTSRFYGRQDIDAVRQVIYNGSVIFAVLGALLSIFGFVFSDKLLVAMNTPVETMEYASTYLRTFLCGLIFCVLYNIFSGALRAMGDSKTPLYVLVFCSFANVLLDLTFVIVLKWGVFGVAFSTILAQAASAIILGIMICKKIPAEKIVLQLDGKIIKDICSIGIPAGLQSIMYSLSNILVQSAINGFGYLTVTAWAAYVKIDNIVDIFVSSLASTVITFVGQNLGANKVDRVKQSVRQIVMLSYIITITLVAGFMFFRMPLLGLFTENLEVANLGGSLMFIIMPMYLLGIPYQMFAQALRGLGKAFVPMLITLTGIVGIRVIWVHFIFPLNPTIYFLGICYPISSFIMSIIFGVYYMHEIGKLKTA
ncbi:MATE family efflux transporter [Konateibacter massiliensis]|uniref:MATE family efflux transporter n=1 Tax=Konateibacter massiliensis TaxID=2002841 RepID=UPI000C15CE82|nr:MATE family efflux transporter [Konateibacter massiliensis]